VIGASGPGKFGKEVREIRVRFDSSHVRFGALTLGGELCVSLSSTRIDRGLRVPRQQGIQLFGRLGLRKLLR